MRAAPLPATPAAMPGQVLVRYAPDVSAEARNTVRGRAGVHAQRRLLLPGLELARVLPGTSVGAALVALNADPRVRYAEPNYLYTPLRISDDTRFGEQWNLHNTGQTIQGVEGIAGADVSAPGAWDWAMGNSNVKVAVIDTGIDYFHPDLAANAWRNPGEAISGEERNGLDDDQNGFTDDVYGWDFIDNSPAPLDDGPHGTAVAGVIGALGSNGLGIAGINWNASILTLRACASNCPTSAIADAAVYGGRMGADVANMSFGGPGNSQAMRDAIASMPSTLFVAAAGNGSDSNDTSPFYPCAYDLPNLICVTGTDNRDNQVFNYGATSVDLGAPALDVLSASTAYRELFSDDFEAMIPQWDYTQPPSSPTPGAWSRVLSTVDASHRFGIEDSEGGDYLNGADTRVVLNDPINLSGETGCFVTLEVILATEPAKDHLHVDAATSHGGPYVGLTRISGDPRATSSFVPVAASLRDFEGQSTVFLRLRLTSNAASTDDGAHVDNVKVRCNDPSGSYGYVTGTSFAAPHVAGAAALLKSHIPNLSVVGLRDRLLRTVDPLPSLVGKTVTGGRLNVERALTADLDPPTVAITSRPLQLSNSSSASFVFSASEAGSTFECRLDGGAFAACSSPKQYDGLADGQHTFGVRAKDAAGNVGPASEATWTIDTTAPAAPVIASKPADLSSSAGASFGFSGEPGGAFECKLDGGGFAACESPVTYSGLEDGSHSFQVRQLDAASNVGSAASYAWTIDTAPPAVTITDGPSGSTTSRAASFAFAAPEPVETFECSLDASAFAECASPASYDNLALGSHTFAVRARDAAGNWTASPTTRDWTIAEAPTGTTGTGGGSTGGRSTGEAGLVTPQAPVLSDPPQPLAFDAPRVALKIPRQTLGGVMRHGLLTFTSTRASCPCRLSQTLRLDAALARSVGLIGKSRAARRAPVIGRASIAVRTARRVRATVQLTRRARDRLRKVRELRGWLDSKLTDRYGRATTARHRIRLSRKCKSRPCIRLRRTAVFPVRGMPALLHRRIDGATIRDTW